MQIGGGGRSAATPRGGGRGRGGAGEGAPALAADDNFLHIAARTLLYYFPSLLRGVTCFVGLGSHTHGQSRPPPTLPAFILAAAGGWLGLSLEEDVGSNGRGDSGGKSGWVHQEIRAEGGQAEAIAGIVTIQESRQPD